MPGLAAGIHVFSPAIKTWMAGTSPAMTRSRRRLAITATLLGAAVIASVARSGHEIPVYPSFYPHRIDIRTLAPERAAEALQAADIQAYVGAGLTFSGTPPYSIRAIESLGSFVMVRVNPQSPRTTDEASACAVVKAVAGEVTGEDFTFHPYPVTPLHGDYIYHADLAEAAKTRLSDASSTLSPGLKVKASGRVALKHPDWSTRENDWDAEVIEVAAANLVASKSYAMNGWVGPPWIKDGWFHAELLLAAPPSDETAKERAARAALDFRRLTSGNFETLVERINLERDLVTTLAGSCRKMVVGYTVKREYFNAEFSAGIENVGYDSIDGLDSPMFLRTAKLKDFPWNGWLALGINASPTAAWNPVGGLTDPFGRLMRFAVTDTALLPAPYDSGWMLNRIADLPPAQGR